MEYIHYFNGTAAILADRYYFPSTTDRFYVKSEEQLGKKRIDKVVPLDNWLLLGEKTIWFEIKGHSFACFLHFMADSRD